MNNFTKRDLKTGHLVTFRNGQVGRIIRDFFCKGYEGRIDIILYIDNTNWRMLESGWNEDLTYKSFFNKDKNDEDIVKVEELYLPCLLDKKYTTVLYERIEE